MNNPTVRLHWLLEDGRIEDAQIDLDLSSFAGVLPSIGDQILYSGVQQGLARNELANRQFLTVVGRVFNPKDEENYVALIVKERQPTEKERALV